MSETPAEPCHSPVPGVRNHLTGSPRRPLSSAHPRAPGPRGDPQPSQHPVSKEAGAPGRRAGTAPRRGGGQWSLIWHPGTSEEPGARGLPRPAWGSLCERNTLLLIPFFLTQRESIIKRPKAIAICLQLISEFQLSKLLLCPGTKGSSSIFEVAGR